MEKPINLTKVHITLDMWKQLKKVEFYQQFSANQKAVTTYAIQKNLEFKMLSYVYYVKLNGRWVMLLNLNDTGIGDITITSRSLDAIKKTYFGYGDSGIAKLKSLKKVVGYPR